MQLPSPEKFLNMLAGAPEVRVLLDREKASEIEAKKQARIQCLKQLELAEAAYEEKKKILDAALSALEKVQSKVADAQAVVVAADLDCLQLARSISTHNTNLSLLHGEGDVQKVLMRIDQEVSSSERRVAIFEGMKNPSYIAEDGRLAFRPVPPNLSILQAGQKDLIKGLQGLRSKAAELVLAPIAPTEIAKECVQLNAQVDTYMQRFQALVRPGGKGPELAAE